MKILTKTLVVAAMLWLPVYVQATQQHGESLESSTNGCMMMKMMSQDEMKAMGEHMQNMQGMMKKIMQEKDPQKHNELMQQHMASMQEGMHMMKGNMGNGMSNKKGMAEKGMKPMNMEKQMEMMEGHMGMMQMMMEQMMEHNKEATQVHK